jgi:hypothetical protein
MLLVDKMKMEVVFVGTDLVTYTTFPGALFSVQRLMEEVQATLFKPDLAVRTAIDFPLQHTFSKKNQV